MAGGVPSSGPSRSNPSGNTTAMTSGVSRSRSLPFSARAGEAMRRAVIATKTPTRTLHIRSTRLFKLPHHPILALHSCIDLGVRIKFAAFVYDLRNRKAPTTSRFKAISSNFKFRCARNVNGRDEHGHDTLTGGLPQQTSCCLVEVARALKDNHNTRLLKGLGAQLDKLVDDFLAIAARDLQATPADIRGQDGHGNAQRGLAEDVHVVDVRTLARQVFHDFGQALVGRGFERGPAELAGIIHADALVDQELNGLDRQRPFFR